MKMSFARDYYRKSCRGVKVNPESPQDQYVFLLCSRVCDGVSTLSQVGLSPGRLRAPVSQGDGAILR